MSIPRPTVLTSVLLAIGLTAAVGIMLGVLFGTVRRSAPDVRLEEGLRVREPDLLGVFEGRVPCADCDAIKLQLVLYRDPASGSPSSYSLYRVHLGKSNDRLVTHGPWQIEGNATEPARVVYQLTDAPEEFSRYLAVGTDILLVLDEALKPRVGDAAYSFTLSRTR